MSDTSLRAKQHKLGLGGASTDENKDSQLPIDEKTVVNPHLDGANQEWKRFYEVIKQLTKDMRD
ncbi:hypothetical protein [Paenibacillus sp. sgz302251]|uniref:hypothetical protein n=1 Tax=Paenibacillus sp. sgz302251 TaxID=3414493 RepID=UPI003C7BDE37